MKFFYGIFFIILGIAGIILPILPGMPFLIIGGFLLGIIPKSLVIQALKKLKIEKKDNKLNKLINYILIRYVYSKEFVLKK
ncbi:MAG: hypothetical protein DSY53_01730 [Persephonella sp.]|nr:MAG: hypothetical protein DSY53_01730 [Persephonella sp.]